MTSIADLDIATVLEAIEALNDGIAIYGADQSALYINAATRRRFPRMHADMDAGMSYRDAPVSYTHLTLPTNREV